MATLTNISITTADDGYQLRLEDDQGGSFEVTATFEQLDLLSEEVDRNLNANEEQELSVDDETSAEEEVPVDGEA